MISQIRHLKNEPIIGRSRIAASLGLGHCVDASIRQFYRVAKKFEIIIKKNQYGDPYINKDDACFFRFSMLSGKEAIRNFLKIKQNTLLKYMNEDPNIPIYEYREKKPIVFSL